MIAIHELLKRMAELHASDLHLTAGAPPLFRVDGSLVPTDAERIAPEEVLKLAYSIMNEAQKKTFEQKKEVDFSFGVQNLARYRANIFLQRGCCACALRSIPFTIQSLDELGLPPVVSRLTERPRSRPWSTKSTTKWRGIF
jgi:twitching motility protein PilT